MEVNMQQREHDIMFDIQKDIEYCDCATEEESAPMSKNKLDLFLPKNADPSTTPVVVFVHGGGWSRGDRRAYKYFLYYDPNLLSALFMAYYDAFWNVGKGFARAGIACAVISYRLSRPGLPWLLLKLFFSLMMSGVTVVIPLVCVAFTANYISHIMYTFILPGYNIESTVTNTSNCVPVVQEQELLPSALRTICSILFLVSLSILWFIVPKYRDGYQSHAKLFPIILSLIFSSIIIFLVLDIQLISFEYCFTLCMVLGFVLHAYQQCCSPAIRHPKHVTDVAKSIAWVVQYGRNSRRYNPNKVFLCGHSAGGHLVSLLALDPKYLNSVGLSPSVHIKGVISVSGVYDLHRLAGGSGIMEQLYLWSAFGRNPDTWTLASPYHRLSMFTRNSSKSSSPQSKDSKLVKSVRTYLDSDDSSIPFLVINAELDFHLIQDAKSFVGMLKERGFSSMYFIVKGSNHLSIILSFGNSSRKPIQEITTEGLCLEFIRKLNS